VHTDLDTLAIALYVTIDDTLGQPVMRSLIAYDHYC
jgi:hypothetical protein